MSDWLEKIKGWLSASTGGKVPAFHEVIERNAHDERSYKTWLNSSRSKRLFNELRQAFAGLETPLVKLDMVNGRSSNGFVLYYGPELTSPQEFQHLFDYLKEKVLEKGYASYVSDVKTNLTAQDEIEKKERHHLKPKWSKGDKSITANQLFGNITIEHITYNEAPSHISMVAHAYNDHKYTPAESLNELLKELFEKE